MSKYESLEEFLKYKVQITLTYAEIEEIIGSELPPSASTDRTWWANTEHISRVQAHAWLNAGWKIHHVDLGKSVIFIRSAKS